MAPSNDKYFAHEKPLTYDQAILQRVPNYEGLHQAALAMLEAQLKWQARVLVAGSGTGRELLQYSQAHPDWSLVGVDPSQSMLAVATEKLSQAGLAGHVVLRQGKVDSLAPAPAFDAAVCLLVSHFLKDNGEKLELFKSIAQRLKPGAPLLTADQLGDPGSPSWDLAMRAWERMQVNQGMGAEEAAARVSRTTDHIHYVSQARYLALLAEAGFTEPQCFWRGLHFEGWMARKA
jgi:tRNA (cmo5U34)-methyltransferase